MTTKDVLDPSECDGDMMKQSREERIEVNANMLQEDQHGDRDLDDNFSANDLLCFAWQIAKGMVNVD